MTKTRVTTNLLGRRVRITCPDEQISLGYKQYGFTTGDEAEIVIVDKNKDGDMEFHLQFDDGVIAQISQRFCPWVVLPPEEEA